MQDAFSYTALNERLDRLERQTRTLKRLLLVSIAGVIAAFGAGSAGAAGGQHPLTVSDATGRVRVKIDAGGFQFFDAAGHRRILLGSNVHGKPALYLEDAHSNYPLGAYISDSGQPVIRLADSNNKGRAYLALSDKETPHVEFDDPSENERLYVGLATDSSGMVRTYGSGGSEETSLQDDKIYITDTSGNKRIYLGTSDTGDGILSMFDSASRQRIYAGVFTDGTAGFEAYDASGTATWDSAWK